MISSFMNSLRQLSIARKGFILTAIIVVQILGFISATSGNTTPTISDIPPPWLIVAILLGLGLIVSRNAQPGPKFLVWGTVALVTLVALYSQFVRPLDEIWAIRYTRTATVAIIALLLLDRLIFWPMERRRIVYSQRRDDPDFHS